MRNETITAHHARLRPLCRRSDHRLRKTGWPQSVPHLRTHRRRQDHHPRCHVLRPLRRDQRRPRWQPHAQRLRRQRYEDRSHFRFHARRQDLPRLPRPGADHRQEARQWPDQDRHAVLPLRIGRRQGNQRHHQKRGQSGGRKNRPRRETILPSHPTSPG